MIPPHFIVERTLTQMKGLQGPPEKSSLVTSVADRAKKQGIAGDYALIGKIASKPRGKSVKFRPGEFVLAA